MLVPLGLPQVRKLAEFWNRVVTACVDTPPGEAASVPMAQGLPPAANPLLEDSKVHAMELGIIARINIQVHERRYTEIITGAVMQRRGGVPPVEPPAAEVGGGEARGGGGVPGQ